MQQKTIWTIFLIIGGINFFLSSCKISVDPSQAGTFVYKNDLENTVKFQLMEKSGNIRYEANIESGDSLVFKVNGNPGASPFSASEIENRVGTSVTITFNDGRCVTYSRNLSSPTFEGTGVFDVTAYSNYHQNILDAKQFYLIYNINDKDLNLGINCK